MTGGRLYVYRGADGRWWWRHVAGNGREDGASEQGYRSKRYAAFKARRAWPASPVVYKRAA